MHRTIALLLPLIGFGSAATAQSQAPSVFSLGTMTVRAPRDTGWQVVRDSPEGVVFSGNTESVGRLAYAQLFNFPPPYDRSSFLAEVARNVEAKFARPGVVRGTASYEYSETRGYPCVSVRTVADIKEQPSWPKGYEQRLHYRMLLCKVPVASPTGVFAAYSYSGEAASAALDAEAEGFLSTLSSNGQ